MKPSPLFVFGALALLAACASEPMPVLQTTDTVQLQRSREILMKGDVNRYISPTVERWTYLIDCAKGNEGGTPEQRADKLIASAPKAAGQVYIPIGPGYQRSYELEALNSVAVPQLQCQVRNFERQVVAVGDTAFMAKAISLNALQELQDKR